MAVLRGAVAALGALPRAAHAAAGNTAWRTVARGPTVVSHARVAGLTISAAGSRRGDAAAGLECSRGLRIPPGGVFIGGVMGQTLGSSSLGFGPAMMRGLSTLEEQSAAPPAPVGEGKKLPPNIPDTPNTHKAEHHNYPRARAVKRKFKGSIKKLNLVCRLVRRSRVDAALMQLSLSPKRAAKTVRSLIYDAKFNACNNHGMDPDKLLIDEVKIGRAGYLKRIEYKGRGKTGVRKRPYVYCAVYVREVQKSDSFVFYHLKRRRPTWKCNPINHQ